jgi:hypothetical protein
MTSTIDPTIIDPHCELLDGEPPAFDETQALLDQAWETGHRKTRLVVDRIRRDLAALPQWIAIADREAAARRRLKDARGQAAEAKAALRGAQTSAAGMQRTALGPDAGTRVPAMPARGRKRTPPMKIRNWLRANGYDVPERGVLGTRYIKIYEDAQCGGAS